MGNEIYYGDFGTGKTSAMLLKIKEAAKRGENCMLFVPEQFSFDTERAVYFAVGAKNFRYVKITGFSKLSREILKLYKKANPCADEAIKLITMWKTAENAKGDFLSLGKEKNSSGFCRLMLKTVAAFRNAGISPEEYRRILENETSLDEELADKAGDFLRIYTDYDREIKENLKLDDKLDDVSRAAALAQEHEYFNGMNLFFDNYDSFSAVQKKMLRTALAQCNESLFCLTCDSVQSNKREFLCISKTIEELKAIAPETVFTRFSVGYRSSERDKNSVRILSAKTPYDEADIAAAEIHRLVRDEGYRYRDILVLTADSEYEAILYRRFIEGEIPVFCDFPHSMTDKPVVGFVLQILKALELDPEEILRLAESGFKRIGEEGRIRLLFNSEVYRLRAVSDSYGLSSSDWQKNWDNDPRKELNDLEYIRLGITEPLQKLKTELDGAADGAEFSEIFMRYLIDEEQIQSTFIAASKAGDGGETDHIKVDEATAEEYGRIWDALCEAFTSMAFCLEGVKIKADRYLSLLEEILAGINLANPPQVLDSVTVGDIERTRKAQPKAIIITGANEGKIPRRGKLQSIFTHFEREHLNNAGLPLYDSNLNRWSKEYYFALRAMNLYGKKLILTFCNQDTAGRESPPADILAERFGNVKRTDIKALPYDYFLNTVSDIRSALARSYGKNGSIPQTLSLILNEKDYNASLEESLRLMGANRNLRLTPETAQKLLDSGEYSPTRLEAAFQCPFMYFCKYGLGLRDPGTNDPASPAYVGTAVHNIMRTALENAGDIRGKSDGELEKAAADAVRAVSEQATSLDPTFPERTRSVYAGLEGRIAELLKQTRLDLEAGGFTPRYFEKAVSYTINNGPKAIKIKGIADRIDILENDKGRHIKIYDYKTGSIPKTFTREGIESGTDLQMLLYLFAECAEEKNSKPAAVGYFSAGKQGMLNAADTTPLPQSDYDKSWYSGHKISGASFDTEEAERAVNDYEKAVREKTKSGPGARFTDIMTLSADKFSKLRRHVDNEIIVPKINALLEGDIQALPLEKEGEKPCDHCSFQSICGNKDIKSRPADPGSGLNDFLTGDNKG